MNDRIYIIRWNTGDTDRCCTMGEVHRAAWSAGTTWAGSRIFDRGGKEVGIVEVIEP